jgi:hypothetical protein
MPLHLWDEGSVTKLVFAVLIRVSERWGKKCFSEIEQQQIRSLRRQHQLDDPTVRSPVTADSDPVGVRVCCLTRLRN